MRDDDVRSACFAALDVLQAKFGQDVPYPALLEGFNFRGTRVPFLNRAYGIYRARAQRGPAALSVNSSFKQDRYRDEQTPDGVLYRYQGDDGPMLDLLKGFDGASLAAPAKKGWRPDPERLALRFERFAGAA